MPIIGLTLNSISASAENKTVSGNVNVNSVPTIEKVEKKELDLFKDVLVIGFRFRTQYEPKIGEIVMEGELLYHGEDTKDILSKWKKERKIEDKPAAEFLNAIFRKCLTESIRISQELRLPPPIQFPVVVPKGEGNKG